MWFNHKFFKFGTGILLTLLIIYMLGKIDFFLMPFKMLVASIFAPLLASGIFYYILRPLVRLLMKIRIPKSIAIVLSFIITVFLFVIISTYMGAIVVEQFKQFSQLLTQLPNYTTFQENILNNEWLEFLPIDEFKQKAGQMAGNVANNLSRYFFGFVSTVTNVGTLILMVPFILFYLLKDDEHFTKTLLGYFPRKRYNQAEKIFKDIDNALSSYIVGQMLVAFAIGIMMFIGYMIIEIKYALILAIFAMITSLVPFFGPTIGIIPAILVSLTISPFMILKVILVMMVTQQIDNNFISPHVMGQRLNVHPVTVILLLLIGSSLYGFLGLLLAVPLYAALKVTVKNVQQIYKYEKANTHKA